MFRYGNPSGSDDFADATERAMEVLINMARLAPTQFKADYIVPYIIANTLSVAQSTNNVFPKKYF